jgi:hypothetical protein
MEHAVKHPKLPELKGHIVKDGWSPPDNPEDCAMRRQLVDWLGVYEECRRVQCRQAEACRSRAVACFEEARPAIIDSVYDFILDGYLVDADAFD